MLTFTEDTADITVTSNKDGKATLVKDTDYAVYTGDDANPATFKIALIDAKSFAGKTITVTYKATLNDGAKLFDESNPNTFNITYSNNPKHDYDGDKDNTKPGLPDSTMDVPTGTTPDETTETFSTGIKIRKVDQDGNALKGATFTIEGDSVEKIVHYTDTFTEATGEDAKYWKLTNNTYTDQAPQTADEMITAPSGATNGYVMWQEGDSEAKVTVGDTDYRVVRSGETPTHILKKKNSEMYASTTTKYKKTHSKTVENSTSHKSAALTVQEDGIYIYNQDRFIPYSELIACRLTGEGKKTYLQLDLLKTESDRLKKGSYLVMIPPEKARDTADMIREFIVLEDKARAKRRRQRLAAK